MNKIDYEHAGLEFVNGDRFSGGTGVPCTVDYFAWRTNTGVKPEFEGKVAIQTESGIRLGYTGDFKYWWTDGTIIRWRPHLPSIQTETPEEKAALDSLSSKLEDVGAIFDCELKDGVITAKVKSPYDGLSCGTFVSDAVKRISEPKYDKEFVQRGGTNAPEVWVQCAVMYRGSKYTILKGKNGKEYSRRSSKLNIRTLKTEKEKAIDALSDVILDAVNIGEGVDFHHHEDSVAKWIYDAGYRLLK